MAELTIVAETIFHRGDIRHPSIISWDTHTSAGWTIWTDIKFTAKGEIKTKFTVTPPFPPESMKKWKEQTFKTTSYKELKKWLKKKGLKIDK